MQLHTGDNCDFCPWCEKTYSILRERYITIKGFLFFSLKYMLLCAEEEINREEEEHGVSYKKMMDRDQRRWKVE